jgi:hypothetical protein
MKKGKENLQCREVVATVLERRWQCKGGLQSRTERRKEELQSLYIQHQPATSTRQSMTR